MGIPTTPVKFKKDGSPKKSNADKAANAEQKVLGVLHTMFMHAQIPFDAMQLDQFTMQNWKEWNGRLEFSILGEWFNPDLIHRLESLLDTKFICYRPIVWCSAVPGEAEVTGWKYRIVDASLAKESIVKTKGKKK